MDDRQPYSSKLEKGHEQITRKVHNEVRPSDGSSHLKQPAKTGP